MASISNKTTFASYGARIATPEGDITLVAGRNITLTPAGNSITIATQFPPVILDSGTYTPVLTNVTNITSSTAYTCQYMRVGATATVSGRVDIQPTAPTSSTILGISLPIASSFGAEEQCGGTAFAPDIAVQGAAILADTANKRANIKYISVDNSNQAFFFTFTYRIT